MPRYVISIALALTVACSAPPPAPPAPPPPAVVAATQVPTAPAAPPAPLAATVTAEARAEPPEAPAPEAIAPTAAAPAASEPGTPSPVPATPTAVALETVTPSDAIGALAAAPEQPGAAAGPTAAVVAPSSRLAVALSPTPNVLASSPSLADAARTGGGADYAGAIKLVQDSRKAPGAARLAERVDAVLARERARGSEIEVEGWQAGLKGSTDLYQVTFIVRENRQGLRAEWEANLKTGEVRPVNAVAEALETP